ncbi:MAG: NAD-dependent epimerase/dehydratase family protein [Limisphaerales bacterium]
MKILFTGATSFTGLWFVTLLAAAGHEIVCTTTAALDGYTGARGRRLDKLKPLCSFVPNSPFGSEAFLRLAAAGKFDLLCHHGAYVTNYKSPDFDPLAALKNNTLNLGAVLKTLACPMVLTGTVFENDEGSGGDPLNAFSPYGLSKGLTFQVFRYYCQKAGVRLGKFVIPNPFGPFEELRFTAYLMRTWREGKIAEVQTPEFVRDNIHADLLAAVYARFVHDVSRTTEPLLRINPSGYVGTQGDFARRVAREVQSRAGWKCPLKLCQQTDFSEPLNRVNTDPAVKLVSGWDERHAWDKFVDFYSQ